MLSFFHTFKRDIISGMNHSQSFFTDANFLLQMRSCMHDKTKIEAFLFSCRGISLVIL